ARCAGPGMQGLAGLARDRGAHHDRRGPVSERRRSGSVRVRGLQPDARVSHIPQVLACAGVARTRARRARTRARRPARPGARPIAAKEREGSMFGVSSSDKSTVVRTRNEVRWTKAALQTAFILSEELGVRLAERLFTSPRRHRRPDRERAVLASGRE